MKRKPLPKKSPDEIAQLPEEGQLHALRQLQNRVENAQGWLNVRRDFRKVMKKAAATGSAEVNLRDLSIGTKSILSKVFTRIAEMQGVAFRLFPVTDSPDVRDATRMSVDRLIAERVPYAGDEDLQALRNVLYLSTFGGRKTTQRRDAAMVAYEFNTPEKVAVNHAVMENIFNAGLISSHSETIRGSILTPRGKAVLFRLRESFGPSAEEKEMAGGRTPEGVLSPWAWAAPAKQYLS